MAAAQEEMQASLPFCVDQVVLWTHHREWTSISNSGSLLPLLLKNVTLLMKGLPEHDTKMNELLVHDPQRIIVVLWPDNDISTRQNHSNTTITNRKTWQQIQEMVIDGSKKITLLAVEGTWRTARRMESKLPPHVIRVNCHQKPFTGGAMMLTIRSRMRKEDRFLQSYDNKMAVPKTICVRPRLSRQRWLDSDCRKTKEMAFWNSFNTKWIASVDIKANRNGHRYAHTHIHTYLHRVCMCRELS